MLVWIRGGYVGAWSNLNVAQSSSGLSWAVVYRGEVRQGPTRVSSKVPLPLGAPLFLGSALKEYFW